MREGELSVLQRTDLFRLAVLNSPLDDSDTEQTLSGESANESERTLEIRETATRSSLQLLLVSF